jgi:CHAT domain-containing protein
MIAKPLRRRLLIAASLVALVAQPAVAAVSPAQYATLREETYEAAQGAVVSAAADAMTNVATRLGQGDTELAKLVTKRQALLSQVTALRKLIQEASDTPGTGLEAVAQRGKVKTLRDQEAALSLELDAAEKTLDEKFPAYTELTRPMPLAAKATQALLGPKEALILIVPASDATYIWIVTHDHFDWARAEMTEDQVTEAVKALRLSLDPSTGVRGAVGMAGATPAPAGGPPQTANFDRKVAYKLYQALIAPLEAQFRDKQVLFVATTGALQSLPFSVLVTAEPKGDDADRAYVRETEWLIDRYALVTLPAVSSLRTLRCLGVRPGFKPHTGCDGPAQARGVAPAGPSIAYAGLGGPALGGDSATGRGSPAGWEAYSNGELADPDKLRALAPLPGAQAEIGALATLFDKRGAFTRTQADFTETLVKTSPQVRSARILHFATHALMGGESGSRGEPGLVLTPPAEGAATALDDGLLTASEAAALDIRADFVVLSACNTARADGTLGADGLSGLARGFFYAGAHSLLVSHWSVDDKSTKELMVSLFTGLDDGKVNRAVALQRAIQTVKQETAFVEPRFWAPFVLVGDNGD